MKTTYLFISAALPSTVLAGTRPNPRCWRPGHRCVAGVTLGTRHDAPGYALWSNYDNRTTSIDVPYTSASPSWYYEHGDGRQTSSVRCTVRVQAGAAIQTVTITRPLQVHTPKVDIRWIPGPISIFDPSYFL